MRTQKLIVAFNFKWLITFETKPFSCKIQRKPYINDYKGMALKRT